MTKKDVLPRYIVFQLPELLLIILILTIIHYFIEFPIWIGVTVVFANIVKEIIMFFYTWQSYIVYKDDNVVNFIGKECKAVEDIAVSGMVRFNGELWRAKNISENVLKKNALLQIKDIKGLMLFVEEKAPN